MKNYYIGVAGYAQAGKDTVVQRLVHQHGFTQVAFADALRDFTLAVNPLIDEGLRYRDALEANGYEQAKAAYPEFRRLLQAIGTEGARETFWDSFWVDLAMKKAQEAGGRVAFSDCRFPNEAQECSENGFVIWVSRAGVGPVNEHVSDNSLRDWDFDHVLTNDSTYEDLWSQVDDMVRRFDTESA